MRSGEICTRSVVTCGRDTRVLPLAQLMRNHHVGDVIVVDEHEGKLTPAGVVTDRDPVVEVMAKSVNPDPLRGRRLDRERLWHNLQARSTCRVDAMIRRLRRGETPYSGSASAFDPVRTSARTISRIFSGSSNKGLWADCLNV